MSAKAIREYHGKHLLSRWLGSHSAIPFNLENRAILITPASLRPEDPASFEALTSENPWLLTTRLVVKPDQLIKRRGKAGLLAINKSWPEVVDWIKERMNKEVQVEVVTGILDHFIVEPFVPHSPSDEYYLCIQVVAAEDLLFYFILILILTKSLVIFGLFTSNHSACPSLPTYHYLPSFCPLSFYSAPFYRAFATTTRSCSITRAALTWGMWTPRGCD